MGVAPGMPLDALAIAIKLSLLDALLTGEELALDVLRVLGPIALGPFGGPGSTFFSPGRYMRATDVVAVAFSSFSAFSSWRARPLFGSGASGRTLLK